MKKFFRWLLYIGVLLTVLVVGVFTTAYWNRDALLKMLGDQLNEGINGTVYIEKIDFTFLHHFPRFTVTLHNVYLRGDEYQTYPRDIFSARKIFLDMRLYPLLKKEIIIRSLSVDQADVFIFKAKNGYMNSEILKTVKNSSDPEKESSILLNLQKVAFHNVAVVYSDSTKSKSMSFKLLNTIQNLSQTDSGYSINMRGKIHVEGLLFNPKAGSFLSDKDISVNLNLKTNRIENILTVQSSFISYKNNEIGITGNFELEKEGMFALNFSSKNVNPSEVKDLLNTKLINTLRKISTQSPVTISVDLYGKSIPGYIPNVDIRFQTQHASLRYGAMDFSKLTLFGTFTNHVDSSKINNNQNSKVDITSFTGSMEKLPMVGKVTFGQLQDPVMDLSFTTKVNYKNLNDHLDNNRFIFESGNFTSEVTYKGKLSEYLDSSRTSYQGKLNGRIKAVNASLLYKPRNIHLDHIRLLCTFNEKNFIIQNLNLNVNGSPVQVKGLMKNFIPFFVRPKNKGYVNLRVKSPNLDLTGLASKRQTEKKTAQQTRRARKKMTDLLDMIYDRLEFDLDLTIDHLTFRKFNASNFTGKAKLDKHKLNASPIKMDVANGTMYLDFSLANVFDPISPLAIDARLVNADIKELFLNFNNFNQKTIHADNLAGTISADVKFNAKVDDSYAVFAPTMFGTLDCKITDGGLKNFEPIENLSNFLFKQRDFSDVEFAELNSNFSIEGTNMDISRMEIQSSVLSLFLQGRYSFTDSTSLSVQIPLSNLKKRHKNFKPQNIGIHAKAGPSVFLHVYRDKDINSKIKIDYDPFKKWAKN